MFAAVTGHRPDKLAKPHLKPYSDEQFNRLTNLFEAVIDALGVTHGMSGMALGADQAWAQALINQDVPWIAALPFPGQERRWPRPARQRYQRLLQRKNGVQVADSSIRPDSGYGDIVKALHARNTLMIDAVEAHDGVLIALWNGGLKGGTASCIREAKERGVRIVNYWQPWQRHG